MDNFGHLSGERCFRDGCEGIITEEPYGDSGCSCHINPPCSHCTTNWSRCETCNWKSSDDEDYRPVPTEYTGLYMMARGVLNWNGHLMPQAFMSKEKAEIDRLNRWPGIPGASRVIRVVITPEGE